MCKEKELCSGQIVSLVDFLSKNYYLVYLYGLEKEYEACFYYAKVAKRLKQVKGVWRFSVGKAARKIVDELLWRHAAYDSGLPIEKHFYHLYSYFFSKHGPIHKAKVEITEPKFWRTIRSEGADDFAASLQELY